MNLFWGHRYQGGGSVGHFLRCPCNTNASLEFCRPFVYRASFKNLTDSNKHAITTPARPCFHSRYRFPRYAGIRNRNTRSSSVGGDNDAGQAEPSLLVWAFTWILRLSAVLFGTTTGRDQRSLRPSYGFARFNLRSWTQFS